MAEEKEPVAQPDDSHTPITPLDSHTPITPEEPVSEEEAKKDDPTVKPLDSHTP